MHQLISVLSISFLITLLITSCTAPQENLLGQKFCPNYSAFCPEDPSLKLKNTFCPISYPRDLEFLSQCGPTQPGPICQAMTCAKPAALPTSIPFDADKACYAMGLIQSGINESPKGIWSSDAEKNLKATVGTTSVGGVRYFHITDADALWIVFLGSVTAENWKTDGLTKLVQNNTLMQKIHEGFSGVADSFYADLETLVKKYPNQKVRLTGHSLGAATAAVLALMLVQDGHAVDTVITFGQPQITDEAGANSFTDKIKLIRFINNNDRVPFLAGTANKSYSSFGPEIRLETNNKGTFAVLPKPDNARKIKARDFLSGTQDHLPAAYISSLNQLFCKI